MKTPIHTMILTLTTSPSLTLPLQTGLLSPGKKRKNNFLSAALTQLASKRVPKAVSYSWMFLVNILFVWLEIDLSHSHFDTGKQTGNWSTSTVCLWNSLHFVALFWNRCRVPAVAPLLHAHRSHTEWWKLEDVWRVTGQEWVFRNGLSKYDWMILRDILVFI